MKEKVKGVELPVEEDVEGAELPVREEREVDYPLVFFLLLIFSCTFQVILYHFFV